MDDVHTLKKPASRIPLLSPFLHFVSMTVVVHFRHSFGFDFLGEKRWFLPSTWAFTLFFIIAWNMPLLWRISPPFWLFGMLTVIAYLIHLLTAFRREATDKRADSRFSGKSHFLPFCRAVETASFPAARLCSLCLEPSLTIALAALCRVILGDVVLSGWLFFAGLCLFTAEFFNYWFIEVRAPANEKELKDKIEKAAARQSDKADAGVLKPTREEEQVPQRNARPVEEELEEQRRHAEVLDLPLSVGLEEVEARFKELIKNEHGDRNAGSPDADRRSQELLEARDFFRRTLRS